ncbi:MAG: methyltransferase MtaB domain-containing protein, partial [Methanobacteriaceae archaeon]|nr:methyltransferase MtaB domain-containing protein [Methanobacteriaceae archaeon]MDD6285836.1 methyltransferase MtaB domain-containing protein [Methanobacteriaceae archaeon]
MSRKYFTKMENESADEMVFGQTKHPVKMGLDQVMGGGEVV